MSPSPTCVPSRRCSPGDQRPGERGEHVGQHLAGQVEQRPPAKDTSEGCLGQVELGGGGDGEPQCRVQPAGVRNHPRRQVDTGDVDAQPREVGGDRSRATADVEHWPENADLLGERSEVARSHGAGARSPTLIAT